MNFLEIHCRCGNIVKSRSHGCTCPNCGSHCIYNEKFDNALDIDVSKDRSKIEIKRYKVKQKITEIESVIEKDI